MKLLLGGSPCTRWSIAQTKNRETEPEGISWELFENYRIAWEKFKPDFFLYENNKSMAPLIRAQITAELGVEPILINSALVSAQSRQRLYWTNIPGVNQPEDRGIMLKDILESGVCWREKGYTLRASIGQHGGASSVLKTIREPGKFTFNGAAEPVSVRLRGRSSGAKWEARHDGKCGALDTIGARSGMLAEPVNKPIRIGAIESGTGSEGQGHRVYSTDGKSKTLCGNGGGAGAKTGLYTVPADCPTLRVTRATAQDQYCGTPDKPIYVVRDGQITIKGRQYPIKLMDGCYIIRKLTVRECMRLQTVPEEYIFPVSDTQAYKMLGNGWTVDVIAHILSFCPGITTEPLDVLSMYDGMSCGRLALDKLGANVQRYCATEIDKYAIKTTRTNFPDTIQLGDAFQVRDKGWSLPGMAG